MTTEEIVIENYRHYRSIDKQYERNINTSMKISWSSRLHQYDRCLLQFANFLFSIGQRNNQSVSLMN